jgi:signal transduction histidine kinase
MTGIVNSYQYFGPRGGGYIIEVSTSLDDAIPRSYPDLDYSRLVDLAFGPREARDGQGPAARIVDLVVSRGVSSWSLFQRLPGETRYAALVERAAAGEEASAREGTSALAVRAIRIDERRGPGLFPEGGVEGDAVPTYYAVFAFDLAPLGRFRAIALFSAIFACLVSVFVSVLALRRFFDRGIAARIDRLRADIESAARGNVQPSLLVQVEDDFGAIGASVASMALAIRAGAARLRSVERMETIGAMAGGLAHDFGNVITGISGTLECVERGLERDGGTREGERELRELVAAASKTAKRGGELVRSLMDLAAPRLPSRAPVDLASIAREASDLAREASAGEPGLSFRVEVPDFPLVVGGDAQALLRAALNLCVNGVQAMTEMRPEGEKRGGTLLVRAEQRPASSEAAIVVVDEGVGLARDDISKLLAPFYSTKPRGIGTGIGLSIALSVAESHGGRLEIDGEPGRGSVFALVVPAQG